MGDDIVSPPQMGITETITNNNNTETVTNNNNTESSSTSINITPLVEKMDQMTTVLNEILWRTFAPEKEYIWVNFKVCGILPLTFIFTAFQLPMINKHKI